MDLLKRAAFLYADKICRLRRFPKERPTNSGGRALMFTSILRYHAEIAILQQLIREGESGVLEKLQEPGFSGLATLNLQALDNGCQQVFRQWLGDPDAPPPLSPPERNSMAFAKPSPAELEHRYKHHTPTGNQAELYAQVRAAILEAAQTIVGLTPCSPEQTRALNALDEAMFLANAAIAREKPN